MKRVATLTLLLWILTGHVAYAKKMYRWTDEAGKIYYSDQIPPEQIKYRRESLTETGRVVDVVEKEKTPAQRKLEKRLEQLRDQQEAIINKQKMRDKVLLSTFRSLDDMNLALKEKMQALDSQKKVLQGNLQRLKKQRQQQQQKAAQYDRDGQPVPQKLLAAIADSEQQIELSYIEIAKHFEKKKTIREKFERDIVRFKFLTQSETKNKVDLSHQTAEEKAASELGLYLCETEAICAQAWQVAKRFILLYSNTRLDTETDHLIMTEAPYKDDDLSLSISKMDIKKGQSKLFLDIRCRESSLGKELCQSNRAKKIRSSFNDYIRAALK